MTVIALRVTRGEKEELLRASDILGDRNVSAGIVWTPSSWEWAVLVNRGLPCQALRQAGAEGRKAACPLCWVLL